LWIHQFSTATQTPCLCSYQAWYMCLGHAPHVEYALVLLLHKQSCDGLPSTVSGSCRVHTWVLCDSMLNAFPITGGPRLQTDVFDYFSQCTVADDTLWVWVNPGYLDGCACQLSTAQPEHEPASWALHSLNTSIMKATCNACAGYWRVHLKAVHALRCEA
jgi:hypothetical protein